MWNVQLMFDRNCGWAASIMPQYLNAFVALVTSATGSATAADAAAAATKRLIERLLAIAFLLIHKMAALCYCCC